MTDRIVIVRPEAERVTVAAAGVRGPAGADGPPGPEGPAGPQGPAGEVTQAELDAATAGMVTSADVTTVDVLTQADYDALATKDPATLYIIEGT